MYQKLENKKLNLFIVLACLFLANAIVAEIIGMKVFSLEKLLGIAQLHLPFILGTKLDLNMSVGIVIWPLVFVISDIVNEYFGRSGVQKLSILGAILIGYTFFVLYSATRLSPSDAWLAQYKTDAAGRPFDINYAYSTIFLQGMGIIVGSITAFLVSQLVDVYTFHFLRGITGHKQLWLRATGSTVVSQIIDSFVVLFIAFYWLGNWSFTDVLAIGLVQYIYKITLAIILTPLVYLAHFIIDRYLGKHDSHDIIEEVNKNW
jgi:queuosine precursor transporter